MHIQHLHGRFLAAAFLFGLVLLPAHGFAQQAQSAGQQQGNLANAHATNPGTYTAGRDTGSGMADGAANAANAGAEQANDAGLVQEGRDNYGYLATP